MSEAVETAYGRWLAATVPGSTERVELEALALSPAELEDAFCRSLHFGNGGLRAKLGQGPNRLNVRTVAHATQGVADWLNAGAGAAGAGGSGSVPGGRPTVLICRDSRHGSLEFARTAAEVLAANGVRAVLFPRIEPTPVLSFGVRHLGCDAGIVITASHNPAEYNGYKVYDARGCQATVEAARAIQAAIGAADPFDGVRSMDFDEAVAAGLVEYVDDSVVDAYVAAVLAGSAGTDCSGLAVAYTPLNGTGLECVGRVLAGIGVGRVEVVEEQAAPDGGFPTCPKPNPEVPQALELGLGLACERDCDLLLATDPDADRLGVAVRHEGEYVTLTGNEVGLLLLERAARRAEASPDAPAPSGALARRVAVTTIVTAPAADGIARAHGFELRRTLTGFKFVGEQLCLLEEQDREGDFLLGIEESLGYLAGSYARDKDGVEAAMLVCELAAEEKAAGRDLVEALGALYDEYGWWRDRQVTWAFEGADGAARMAAVMAALREEPPQELAGMPVEHVTDFAPGAPMPVVNPGPGYEPQVLPPSDVLQWDLGGGSRVLMRPSGTEPKLKAYVFARAATREAAEALRDALAAAVGALVSQMA